MSEFGDELARLMAPRGIGVREIARQVPCNPDQSSVAFILARKAQLAGDLAGPGETVALAEASMRLAGPSSRIGTVAATLASHGHALAGDTTGCHRLADQARTVLGKTGGTGLPWAKFSGEPYIDVHHASSLAVLGENQAAAALYRKAISGLQPATTATRASTWPAPRSPAPAPAKQAGRPPWAFRPSPSAPKPVPGAPSPNWLCWRPGCARPRATRACAASSRR